MRECDNRAPINGTREHESLVVVCMLADEIDAARSRPYPDRRVARHSYQPLLTFAHQTHTFIIFLITPNPACSASQGVTVSRPQVPLGTLLPGFPGAHRRPRLPWLLPSRLRISASARRGAGSLTAASSAPGRVVVGWEPDARPQCRAWECGRADQHRAITARRVLRVHRVLRAWWRRSPARAGAA